MKFILSIVLCVLLNHSFSQDERFYRGMFNGVLTENKKSTPFKVKVFGPKYMIDLDRDGVKDSFQTIKKDGVDFVRVNNSFGELMFEGELDTKGKNSKVFKANFFKVKKDVHVLVFHFYEGENGGRGTFESSARLYFLTIENKNLKKITMTKGPYFWVEKKKTNQYFQREYLVNLIDYNEDGQKEISINYKNISRVFYYTSNGIWNSI